MSLKKSQAILHVIDGEDNHYVINYGANNIYTEVNREFEDWGMGWQGIGRDLTSSSTTLSGDVQSTVVTAGSLDESVARLIAASSRRAQEAEEKAKEKAHEGRDDYRRRGFEAALEMLMERYGILYPEAFAELLSSYDEDHPRG